MYDLKSMSVHHKTCKSMKKCSKDSKEQDAPSRADSAVRNNQNYLPVQKGQNKSLTNLNWTLNSNIKNHTNRSKTDQMILLKVATLTINLKRSHKK